MSLKHLAKGSLWPVLQPNVLRLYSMHFCPYAQRARLILAHKNVKYEIVNINLKYKPDWFLARNPLGLVPVLELNDKQVFESEAIVDYLDQLYPDPALYPADPYEKALHRQLMCILGKVSGMRGLKMFAEGKGKENFQERMNVYESALKQEFFAGSSPGMVDFHVWPWFERFPAFAGITGTELLPKSSFPKLHQWEQRMMQVPAVMATWIPPKQHVNFFISLAKKEPDYDANL